MTTPPVLDEEFGIGSRQPPPETPRAGRGGILVFVLRIVAALSIPIIAFYALYLAFDFLRDADANRIAVVTVAIVVGVGGVWALYWGMDFIVGLFPERIAEAVRPAVFVGPALVLLLVYLVYPAINTTVLSFRDRAGDGFVGFDNYVEIFTNSETLVSIRNSVAWVIIVPAVAVAIGLAFATLADKIGKRSESVSKAAIFMPLAISLVGASVVWRFVYSYRPPGFGEQVGLLNGIWTSLGNDPVAWLQQQPMNNLYLMVILIWLQTGFAMVILSSAIKSVPEEIIEAARIDGATEWTVFRRIVFPTISSTVVVVVTTIVITTWKVFDIVYVMTGGNFNTSVIAERMITEFFTFRNSGRGAALAVILFLAVIPVMVINIKRFRAQEATR